MIRALGEAHSLDISPKDQLGVLSATKIQADAGRSKTVSEVQAYIRRRIDVNTGSEGVNNAGDTANVVHQNVNILIPSLSLKDKDLGQRDELAKDKERQEQEKYDLEKALELQKQLDERKEVVVKEAHDIDWSDPAVIRYHALQNRSFSIAEVAKGREDKDKRQKMQDDPEKPTLMEYVEVISDSKEIINVIPLAVKSPIILLYRLFNEKYASTRPGFDDLVLWGDMKIMFEPDGDDAIWKNHYSQELIEWKLYDSCGVHSMMLGEVSIHMLVEKKYPLPQDTLTRMLQWKLHVNYNVTEMAYELLRFGINSYYCDDWKEAREVKILETYDHTLPQKEKDPRSFTLPYLIYNVCFDKAFVDLGASVSVMPFSTYSNLSLDNLAHTRLTIELADRTIKHPRGIAENVLVRIGKFIFLIDFVILDIPEDDDVPLILG
ncbi:putative reverse transcriptase domain-containing protein [Tanacetum coccineum]